MDCAGNRCEAPTAVYRPELRVPTMANLLQDATMLLYTVIFFGLAFLYVKACQKLR